MGGWREIRSLVSDLLSWKYLLESQGEILEKAVQYTGSAARSELEREIWRLSMAKTQGVLRTQFCKWGN